MPDKSMVLTRVCDALGRRDVAEASAVLSADYPFSPVSNLGRRYSPLQCTQVFARDGFIDRYSGTRLIFPGVLRLISILLPREFPFHRNWRTDACHFAYYELFPTIDHMVPVARGGPDHEVNWFSTSMLRNTAKANFTLEELGWQLFPPGNLREWDGLMGWFLQQAVVLQEIQQDEYLRRWAAAAKAVMQQ